ncbi:methionyl-tRNA formyltransferase [Anaerococcus prevotii]|uniref:Methionyl-tRNA formyltransferase n=1 Tax=Anaerococcus prevotii ACS-065-V-Col13 TaxID=879305 RepID=F0GWJ3_9FIRM|nr:methionyl-tRNA formyltransferase [Anaerococcus prevotii]EGC81897.1 methionyl-tRNA formyltransferase [Anaerococcus prevotii ACS-065-V-Col13]
MINICFMGNPKFAVRTLDILYKDKDIDVELVVSSEDKKRSRGKVSPTEIKKYAQDNDIDVVTPKTVNTEEFVNKLKELDIDYIVVVAFGQMIGNVLLEAYPDRIINLHPSKLPEYRGASPMQFSILNGDKITSATTMLIEKGMDSGDILMQKDVEIKDSDDYTSMEEKLGEIGALAIRDTLLNFDSLYEKRIKQDDEKATFCTKITKDMGKINWSESSFDIINKIRAFVEYPVAHFSYEGKNVKVYKAEVLDSYNANPGFVYKANSKEGIVIGTGDGAIRLLKIQFPGKKAMDVKSFLMGNDFKEAINLD